MYSDFINSRIIPSLIIPSLKLSETLSKDRKVFFLLDDLLGEINPLYPTKINCKPPAYNFSNNHLIILITKTKIMKTSSHITFPSRGEPFTTRSSDFSLSFLL